MPMKARNAEGKSGSIMTGCCSTIMIEMGLSFRSNANMWWDAGDYRQVNDIILQR